MRRTVTILLLMLCACARAQCFSDVAYVAAIEDEPAAGGGGATYLINQGFEGSGGAPTDDGYDNSEVWSETLDPDEDYATAPAPLVGSQSLRFAGDSQRATSPTFTAQDEVYTYFMFRPVSFGTTGGNVFVLPNVGVSVDFNSSGQPRIGGSVNSARTTDGMSAGTTYFMRIRYRKDLDGGAASAIFSVEFSTTDAFTGSGNKYTEVTNGTETGQIDHIQFRAETGGTPLEWIIDKVKADDVVINGNPP